jgi:hypothetical protein
MVLDLKPPPEPTLKALHPLWPTAISCAVSDLFIAIIWVTIAIFDDSGTNATTNDFLFYSINQLTQDAETSPRKP